MRSRRKVLFRSILYTFLIAAIVWTLFAYLMYVVNDNKVFAFILIALLTISVICGSYLMLSRTEKTFYDDNGITSYRFRTDTVFIAWASITQVELRTLPRVGKVFFIYDEQRSVFSPFEIKHPKYDAVQIIYSYKFVDMLHKHRPDITLIRID